MASQALEGGITNVGKVVRDGDHLLRPSTAHTSSIHAFLRALRATGFEGAPLPIGVDDDGRERLEFITGDVPLVPYPDWAQSDAALASIARLLRKFHEAAQAFDPMEYEWETSLADPRGGTVVCHNDLELSNIVFRDGQAVAFIDFEFAAPGRPVFDVAQFARLCLPIDDVFDRNRMSWQPADWPTRCRLIANEYGLESSERKAFLTAIDESLEHIERWVRSRVESGDAVTIAALERTGGIEKYDRRRRWWAAHRSQFARALD